MSRSLRVRIALAVFGAIFGLLGLQLWLVLGRVEAAFESAVDQTLLQELDELRAALERGALQEKVDLEVESRSKWNELFVEVLDREGGRLAASANVPSEGLPETQPWSDSAWSNGAMVHFREEVDPHSRKRHRRIRIAEAEIDGTRIRVAGSLRLFQKRYWALRATLLATLAVILLGSTAVAYGAASWILRPVQRLTLRARELIGLPTGELPHTGSGDEIDALAVVLNNLLQRLRAEMGRMRRLTADAAHALRTPLTVVRGNLELEIGRTESAREGLVAALEEVDRLIRLVNELLLLEKLEARGGRSRDERPFDLGALVEELTADLGPLAEDRGIDLSCRAGPLRVRGTPGQIRQAVLNLLDNALRHTPRGGSVRVEARAEGDLAVVAVRDTGPGLGPEALARVFERFYSQSGTEGTGLGLPIARAIARAHGGELRASSPGGALFELELPLALGG